MFSVGLDFLLSFSAYAYLLCYYVDGSYKSSSNQEASDVLSEILKDIPHKPMKAMSHEHYSGGHSFNQLPIPQDRPAPPFKPLSDYQTYDLPIGISHSLNSQYGLPNHYSEHSGQYSEKKPVAVNPKIYDTYRSMQNKMKRNRDKNFVTLPTNGLEIQKSIEYELKA